MSQNKAKRRASRTLLLGMAVVLTAVAFVGCGNKGNTGAAGGGTSAEVVAVYQEGQVTKPEFDTFKNIIKFVNPMYGAMTEEPTIQKSLLDQLIAFKVLQARADAGAKKDAETKAKEQMAQVTAYFEQQSGSKDGFDNSLKELSLTKDDIEQYIERSIVVSDTFDKKVTDDQVKSEYDNKLKADPTLFDTATVAHVLVGFEKEDGTTRTNEEALARAKEVQQKLQAGGDFAALAKEYSDDSGSKDNGGKYENADVNGWVEPFKKAAIELPINQISDPVETSYGYHVMKVESRSKRTYEEVAPAIRAELAEVHITEFMEKELPGLITSTHLPEPEAAPGAGAAGGAAGTPTPAPATGSSK